ncbi:neck protein [Synechococcus phage S-CBM2]|nr:neck protein [Synechococcus phage S-CBM2]
MATNSYFTQGTSGEQNLIQDLIDEQIKIFGKDVKYLPRTLVDKDELFKEDAMSTFDSAYTIEAYIANIDGFSGDGDLFSKFGVRISDQATFIVSRRRFTEAVDDNTTLIVEGRPNEGDLIYFPLAQKLFEIKFVEHESPFYQLNKQYVWEIRCELFEYSDEDFNTGDNDIDIIETNFANSIALTMAVGGTGDYTVGESVFTQLYYPTAGTTLSGDAVSAVTITDGGEGYTSAPTVVFSSPGNVTGVVSLVTLSNQFGSYINPTGTGYTYNTVYTTTAITGTGTGLTYRVLSFGSISFGTIVNPGKGYAVNDVVRVNGGNNNGYLKILNITSIPGTLATGTATISNSGIVTGVTITNAGAGYSTAPTLSFSRSPKEKSGEVKAWDSASRLLTVINRSGDLTGYLDGDTSNAEWEVQQYSTIDNTNSEYDQNKYIETTADGFLDFTEGNPFGEFGNQGTSL